MERREKARRMQKKRIGILVAVVTLLVFAFVGIGIALSDNHPVDESIFTPGDGRLVVAMSSDVASFDESEYEPEITRIVYFHNGKDITDMKVYFGYNTVEEAKEANENITLDDKEWAVDKKMRGKYIVFNVNKNQYEGITVEEMEQTIAGMRSAGTLLDESTLDLEEENSEE